MKQTPTEAGNSYIAVANWTKPMKPEPLTLLIDHAEQCSLCRDNPFGVCIVGYGLLAECLRDNPSGLLPESIARKPMVRTFMADKERRANAFKG